jgi:hypothetical protein
MTIHAQKPGSRRRLHLVCIIVALSLATTPARASGGSVRDALSGDALATFDHGTALIAKKQWVEARADFERAYAASGEPRVLYNVAVCEKALGRYVRAARALRKSLEGRAKLSKEYVALAERALELLEPYIGALRVEVSETGATVYVDGEAVGTAPLDRAIELDVGAHTIAARKDGFVEQTQTIDVTHEGRTVRVVLAPVFPSLGATTAEGGQGAARPTGTLRVQTDDPMSVLYVDGERRGRGELSITLAAGEHRVTVLRDGKQVYASELVLAARETKTVSIQVASRGEVSPWVWIVSGAVVIGGASVVAAVLISNNNKTRYEGTGAGNVNPGVAVAGYPTGALFRF